MKNISKRIACVALSLLCVFMSTYTVYADNSGESNWEHLSNGHVVVNGVEYEPMEEDQVAHEIMFILNKLGVVGKIYKGIVDISASIEILGKTGCLVRDDAGNIYVRTDRKTEDGDNIKFSSDYVNGVRNGIADIIETEDGYAFIPTFKVSSIPSHYFLDENYYSWYAKFCKYIAQGNYIGFVGRSGYPALCGLYASCIDLNNIDAFVGDYTNASAPTSFSRWGDDYFNAFLPSFNCYAYKNGLPLSFNYYRGMPDASSDYSTNLEAQSSFLFFISSGIRCKFFQSDGSLCDDGVFFMYTSDGHAVKVYKSKDAYVKYIDAHGTQNFYTSNTYNNYNVNNDNSITINKKVYNDTDYETINNNNYTTINNTVNKYYEKNNTTIDTSSIEDIIKKFQDDQAKRDQELLDKVEDNNNKTDEGNQINKETNEKLDKIYEILQQIAGSLSGGGSGGTGSDFDMNTLIQMLNNLQLSLDTMWQVDLKQIQSNLNTIVNDLKSDNADSKSILEDIYKTQRQILELQEANLNQNKTFFDSVIDYLKKITHALTAGNIIDTLDTLLNLKDDVDGLSDFVDGIVGDIEPTVSLMKTKFPTSIPWDIIAVISVMACDPQTPRFEIPINIDIMGQKYEDVLVIDLEQFNRVARFGRALLSVMFTLWLLLVTKRLLYGGES